MWTFNFAKISLLLSLSTTWASPHEASASSSTSFTPSQKEAFLKASRKIDDHFLTSFEKHLRNGDKDRRLQFVPSRQCGEMIGIVTADEVRALGNIFVQALLPDGSGLEGFRGLATQTLLGLVQYDFQVFKACMSCEELEDYLTEEQISNTHEYAYRSYCDEEDYGYDAVHSSLVFLPIDPETDEPFTGKLNAHMNGRGSTVLQQEASSSFFPSSLTDYLTSNEPLDIIVNLSDYMTACVVAGAGSVVISPDLIGYGESYLFDRTYLFRPFYSQAYANSFYAAKSLITNTTNGCTELADSTTLHGFSEGGTACVSGAFALEQIGVNVINMHLAAAPLDGQEQFSFAFKTAQMDPPLEGNSALRYTAFLPFIAYAFSKDTPGIPHSGITTFANPEYLVAGEVSRDLLSWFDYPAPLGLNYIAFVPNPVTDVYNPAMIEMFNNATADGISKPCYEYATTNETMAICDTLIAGTILHDLDTYATFPITMCYSDDDTLVPTSVVEEYKAFQNPNILEYMPLVDFLAPMGDHSAAQILCSIPPIQSLSAPGVIVMEPFSDLPAHCPVPPSPAPSLAPSMSPTTSAPTMSPTTKSPVAPDPTAAPVAPTAAPVGGTSSAISMSIGLSAIVVVIGVLMM